MSSEKKIILKSSDGEVFEVEENVALESQTIKHMVEQGFADTVIPLPRVTSMILSKVIEYCKRLVEARAGDKKDGLNELKTMDLDELFDITKAANYLAIKSLLDVTLQIVADMLKGKTPEEIRKIFNIENDLTLEEESEFRRENQWAFE